MSGNITLLIISFVFIGIITIYLRNIWPDLDIIDLYIIFILLNFGLIPFLRGLYFGKDIVFDFRYGNSLALALVFGHILIIMLIVRGVLLLFPPRLNDWLKIRFLIQKAGCANLTILLIVWVILVLFPVISYFVYGVKPYIMPKDFEQFGESLPYWFTSIRTIYNYIAFWVFLGLIGNTVKSKKIIQLLWSFLTIILILAVTIYGRRFLVNMLIVWVVFWLVYKKENIFRFRYVTVSLLLIVIFFLFSNFYQTYRTDILFKSGEINAGELENPFLAALNYHSTIRNLQIRAGTWEFNYLVFNQQINNPGITTDGKLTWEAFKSSMPRSFWPAKHFILIDNYLASFFMVKGNDVNIAKNIFGIAQLDFGYYSIIIISVVLLILIIGYVVIVGKMCEYPIFLIMFAGNIIWYLINFEANGNEIFFMLRNIIIILLLFAFYILAYRLCSLINNHKIDKI